VLSLIGLLFAFLTPLPEWRESERPSVLAGWAMVGEVVVITAIVTVIRVFVGSA
jgi:hypothetical protein